MLADKFWLNPDSKMIWVKDNHIKTLVENPLLFEYEGKEDLDRLLHWYLVLYGKTEMKYTSVDNFYEKANSSVESKTLGVFEYHVYEKGFVWCEFNDISKILTLRSSSTRMIREALDDVKEHIDEFDEVHLNIFRTDGSVIKSRLVGKTEINIFLHEMILPRKAQYVNPTRAKPPEAVKVSNTKKNAFWVKVKRFINRVYA